MGNSKSTRKTHRLSDRLPLRGSGADVRRPASSCRLRRPLPRTGRIADGMKLTATIIRSVEAGKRAGSPVGNLTGGSVTYSNNLEKIETIRNDGLIEGADPTISALTGRIDVRFADTTLIDLAAGGPRVRVHALGAGEGRPDRTRGLSAQAQARGRGPGRRAGELRLPWREERYRRPHAHRDPDQRPRRVRLLVMHNLLLRLAPSSVDVRP
jgi:Phage tail tube protein